MNIADIEKSYQEIIDREVKKLHPLKKKIFMVALFRLLLVITGSILCYFTWKNTILTSCIIFIFFTVFILLLKYHTKLFYKKKYSQTAIKLATNEYNGLNYNFAAFDGAPEYIKAEHSFSYDLDLFGDRSLFQSVNRSVTTFGKESLAHLFLYPFTDKDKIIQQQESIQELTKKQEFINHFRVLGSMTEKEDIGIQKFSDSFSHKPLLYKHKFWEIMTYLIPSCYVLLAVLTVLNITSALYFIPLWLITFTISSFSIKYITKILDIFDKKTDILSTYISLFEAIEKEKFTSLLLKNNQEILTTHTYTSIAIQRLERFCSHLNMGLSYPVTLFFNPVLFWNVRYAIKIEKWLETYQSDIPKWFDSLAKFDSLSSLSTFAYTHPGYNYPKAETSHFIFEGKELGHPLINRYICVTNDVHISKDAYFLVITGANMAGKSTYLRTIGVNHVLACIGAPVFAQSLQFSPGNLITNLRTTDSLVDHESYFFSELKRLKMIIDRLKTGESLFIILDEILKGTNSEDKQKGSLALMKQLISLKGNGIIATHDLVLGSLEANYPDNIKNFRFEADICHDELSFDYKIKEGIAQNMNATFLMKKMGITGL